MPAASERSTVFAVVPTFHPPADLPSRLERLAAQLSGIVVVDDGTGPSADVVLAAMEAGPFAVVRLPTNTGIAAALNHGIRAAVLAGATHVLTVDQDSTLDADYVMNALAALTELKSYGAGVLAVAAGTVDGAELATSNRVGRFSRVRETLQSGLLFPVTSLAAAGDFDESLFIDCVDSDMLLRGATLGLHTFFVPECRIVHRLGEAGVGVLPGGRRLEFAYHGPVRRYYITRNRAVIESRFGGRFPRWAAVQLVDQTRYFACCLLFGRHPTRQLLAAAAGLLHAASGRRGPIPRRLAAALQA